MLKGHSETKLVLDTLVMRFYSDMLLEYIYTTMHVVTLSG